MGDIKLLKIIINIWFVIITTLTMASSFLFGINDAYGHPIAVFGYIFAITSYMSIYKFYKMLHGNQNKISLLQLKVWSMLFSRGVSLSCLYLSFYAKNIWGVMVFGGAYFLKFICNRYLKKAINEK